MELAIETSSGVYEISELVSSITYTDNLNNGCSKLEFTYVDKDINIGNGSFVGFIYGNLKFYGVVFKNERNHKKEVNITAYDKLRYAKAKDTIVSKGETITSHVIKMCDYLGLSIGELANTGYVLSTEPKDDKTWLDIIYEDIRETLTNTGKWYCLRDEFGSICLRDLDDLKLNLILGDGSLCYGFSSEKSIDEDFYNRVKLASDNEVTASRDVYIAQDGESIATFGLLQYFQRLDKNFNPSQAKSMADALLKLYNREMEKLSMECLGDTRIRAGSSFIASINDAGVKNKRLIVNSVTHSFLPVHTMDLEVFI